MRHLFLSQVTDREVTDVLATTLRQRDPSPRAIRDEHGRVTLNGRMLAPSWFYKDVLTTASATPQPGPVDTRLTFAALALAALARKDYERACELFVETSRLYELQEFLPYYAFAAARVGETGRLERYLANAQRQKETLLTHAPATAGEFFDEYLSHAVLEAARENVETALDYLVRANADVQQTEERAMFTRYEIAEVAELIYEHSHEPRYRDFIVDLARRNTVVDPMTSWPYAFVARYSDDVGERKLALARALYLDPQSKRALSASAQEIADARRLLSSRNPLLDSGQTL
jgi:hypothetical protein